MKLYVPVGATVTPKPGEAPVALSWREATDAEVRSAFFCLDENMESPAAGPPDTAQAVVDTISP